MSRLLGFGEHINQPPYTSAVILELRRDSSDPSAFYVQALLKNNTADQPISYTPLSINGTRRFKSIYFWRYSYINLTITNTGCDLLCPYERFTALTDDLAVDNILEACHHLSTKCERYCIYRYIYFKSFNHDMTISKRFSKNCIQTFTSRWFMVWRSS